jgi:hypothetical protein
VLGRAPINPAASCDKGNVRLTPIATKSERQHNIAMGQKQTWPVLIYQLARGWRWLSCKQSGGSSDQPKGRYCADRVGRGHLEPID